ncbi:MAG: DUF1549 domain-containing protein, partial [Bacteroidota bacterium]
MIRSYPFLLAIALLTAICLLSQCADPVPSDLREAQLSLPDKVDFNYHVKPLLSDRCFKCHGPDANQRQADLRLDFAEHAYGNTNSDKSVASTVLTPGNLRKSELFRRLVSDDPDIVMPTPESNLSLSANEKALLIKWIEQGAEYQEHWSFVAPQQAKLPTVAQKDWPQQELDHFMLKAMEDQELTPAAPASKSTLLRRITIDLTGLPPTPTELAAFLGDDRPDAYERAIDRLMATPQYGERMAVEWLDVARYADSHGYQDDGMRNTWPWREWVIRKFNENMPYDQFITEQLAGDLLPNPTSDQLLATCFNRNHPQTQEGGVVDEEYRVEYVADRTNTFGKALMGITMECARCHDHKYDPISQKDYYQLYAFFNNNNDSGIVPYNGEATPTVMLPTETEAKKLAALRSSIEPLEAQILPSQYLDEFR